MASMRDIKNRRAGIESTQQITKAMKLVATIKLQRARIKAENSRPYTGLMYDTIRLALSQSPEESIYTGGNGKGKKAVVVITANRGLAGGYNQNIVRMIAAEESLTAENTLIYALGRKGKDALAKMGYQVEEDYSEVMNQPLYQDARDMAMELLDSYHTGKVDEIYLAYTSFKNMAVHKPALIRLLPLEPNQNAKEATEAMMNFEPDSESVLNSIMPQYLGSLIYGALLESAASEHGARMAAMDSATANAGDMIAALELTYNRARQGSITQELTEIIAGANAI